MENSSVPIPVSDLQKGFLTLPFDEEQFKEFVTGLLGTPQKISKRIRGNFEIHLKDLQNFHELLEQRVAQQNQGKLMQLRTIVYYNDDSSVELSSLAELITYNEVKPIVSEAVRMTWSYLIKFADKQTPEKQEIELMIISTPFRKAVEEIEIEFLPRTGEFRINIEHTARTWGADIESLLTNQISSILKSTNKLQSFLKRKSDLIGTLVGVLFLLGSLFSIYYQTITFNKNEITKVSSMIEKTGEVNDKVNYLLTYIATNNQNFFFTKSLLFIVGSVFISILLGVWVASMANNKAHSYIVLTREAVKMKDILENKRKRKTAWFFVSIIASVLTEVISSYIFNWLTS
jgi:hypothetical protein